MNWNKVEMLFKEPFEIDDESDDNSRTNRFGYWRQATQNFNAKTRVRELKRRFAQRRDEVHSRARHVLAPRTRWLVMRR
jgi:hypothetical protein